MDRAAIGRSDEGNTMMRGRLAALSQMVREREISARELVGSALDRISAARSLNAVTALRASDALREADLVDAAVARGDQPGPFAGLPLLVKDLEDVTGLPTTFGSLLYRDAAPAEKDALVPRRLRSAGAIVVGKTNLSEFAFKAYASNRLYGSTVNPWATAWSPGGSSGGSAAALAAGLVALATASDGGGSIRIPAAECGLVGLKPTNGLVARDPIPPWPDLSTDGPMGCTVADVRDYLEIIAGPAPGDPAVQVSFRMLESGLPAQAFAAPRIVPGAPLPPTTEALFKRALSIVDGLIGVPIEPIDDRPIFRSGDIDADWFRIAAVEQAHHLGRDVIEANADLFEEAFIGYMRQALEITLEDYVAARRRRYDYTRELDELLGDDSVLLTPTVTVEGWSPDGFMPNATRPGLPLDAFNTQAQNVTGHPAITLPAGKFPNGIPFGLQVTGPRFRDSLLLAFAEAWEAAQPWPLVADGYLPFGPPAPLTGEREARPMGGQDAPIT